MKDTKCNCAYYDGLKKTHHANWYCDVHGTRDNHKPLEKLKSAFDDQEGGQHYKDFVIQPLEFITKNGLSWFVGSIVKYACRHDKKGGAEDMKKIIHYARLCLEQDYKIKSEINYSS